MRPPASSTPSTHWTYLAPGSLFVQTASKRLTSLRPGDEITADFEVLPAERSPATPNQGR
jgi:hypothetical protein